MELPESLKSRIVTGQFLVGVVDGPDLDKRPDAVAASGSVTFVASVPYLPVLAGTGNPVTVALAPIKANLDDRGYLCTPDASDPSGKKMIYEGAALFTTDNPAGSVTNWTWTATFRFDPVNGVQPAIPAITFALPEGDLPIDLATLIKIPSSPGIGAPQAFAMLAEAKQAATDAKTAYDAALELGGGAGGVGPRGEQGLPGKDGVDGQRGPTGLTGAQGPAGTNGVDGAPGKDGATGERGPQGLQGDRGIQGVAGTNGTDGATGPAGKDGTPGAKGADSTVPGPQGPAGAVVTTLFLDQSQVIPAGTAANTLIIRRGQN